MHIVKELKLQKIIKKIIQINVFIIMQLLLQIITILLCNKNVLSIKPEFKFKTKHNKAKLVFPIGKMGKYLKEKKHGDKISLNASIFITAVIEYMLRFCKIVKICMI